MAKKITFSEEDIKRLSDSLLKAQETIDRLTALAEGRDDGEERKDYNDMSPAEKRLAQKERREKEHADRDRGIWPEWVKHKEYHARKHKVREEGRKNVQPVKPVPEDPPPVRPLEIFGPPVPSIPIGINAWINISVSNLLGGWWNATLFFKQGVLMQATGWMDGDTPPEAPDWWDAIPVGEKIVFDIPPS